MNLDVGTIWLIFTVIINLLLAFGIYFKTPTKTKANLFYALAVLSASFWNLCMVMFRISEEPFLDLWSVLLWVATVPIVFFFVCFSLNFPEEGTSKQNLFWIILTGIPALIILLVSILRIGLFKEIMTVNGYRGFLFNLPNFYFYCLYIVGYFSIGFVILAKKYLRATGILKRQIVFVIIGTLISAFGGVIFGLVLPLMQSFKFYWLSPGSLIAVFVAFAYAIFKHHLLNIKVITTELFSALITIILLINALSSKTWSEFWLKFALFIGVAVFTILLIRSVLKEVETREEMEELAKKLAKTNIKMEETNVKLEQANEQLKKLDQAKSEFVSIASHQLHAPLTAIKGYSSMLLEGSYGEIPIKAKDALDKIFQSSNRLVLLIADFLNLSRIERGKMEYNFQKFDLKKIVKEIVEEFKTVNLKREKPLDFRFRVKGEKSFMATIDPDKMRQVVYNLIDNAMKYTVKGFVRIYLYKNNGESAFILRVKDSGAGMDKEAIVNLFQKFKRAEEISKMSVEGTGLGLYVAQEILKAHGGKIWAESEGEGKGSTFYIELPVDFEPAGNNKMI